MVVKNTKSESFIQRMINKYKKQHIHSAYLDVRNDDFWLSPFKRTHNQPLGIIYINTCMRDEEQYTCTKYWYNVREGVDNILNVSVIISLDKNEVNPKGNRKENPKADELYGPHGHNEFCFVDNRHLEVPNYSLSWEVDLYQNAKNMSKEEYKNFYSYQVEKTLSNDGMTIINLKNEDEGLSTLAYIKMHLIK